MKRYVAEQEKPEIKQKRLAQEVEKPKQKIILSALAQFKGFEYGLLARDIPATNKDNTK